MRSSEKMIQSLSKENSTGLNLVSKITSSGDGFKSLGELSDTSEIISKLLV